MAPGWKVIHKNAVTVDNRMENLTLVPEYSKYETFEEPSNKSNREQSLYWVAIQQLPADPVQEVGVTMETENISSCHGDQLENIEIYIQGSKLSFFLGSRIASLKDT